MFGDPDDRLCFFFLTSSLKLAVVNCTYDISYMETPCRPIHTHALIINCGPFITGFPHSVTHKIINALLLYTIFFYLRIQFPEDPSIEFHTMDMYLYHTKSIEFLICIQNNKLTKYYNLTGACKFRPH